jgi:hypothetical protein
VLRGRDVEARRAAAGAAGVLALRAAAPGFPSAGLRPGIGAPAAREAPFECVSSRRCGVESYRFQESELKEKRRLQYRSGDVVCGAKRQVVLGPQLRGMFERPLRCEPAACAYAFVESALVCRRVPTAERCVANSTKASAVFGAGEPAATDFVLQVSDYVALAAQ